MDARTYRVNGMSCDHCRSSVTEEVSEISGVNDVEVELEQGLVSVRGDGFTDDQVAAAVSEAGYEFAGTV